MSTQTKLSIAANLDTFLWFKRQVISDVGAKEEGNAYIQGTLQERITEHERNLQIVQDEIKLLQEQTRLMTGLGNENKTGSTDNKGKKSPNKGQNKTKQTPTRGGFHARNDKIIQLQVEARELQTKISGLKSKMETCAGLLYSKIINGIARDVSRLLIRSDGSEITDGIELLQQLEKHFKGTTLNDKTKACMTVLTLRQRDDESGPEYLHRYHRAMASMLSHQVTLEKFAQLVFLNGLNSKYDTFRQNLATNSVEDFKIIEQKLKAASEVIDVNQQAFAGTTTELKTTSKKSEKKEEKKNESKYCTLHGKCAHDTNNCRVLKKKKNSRCYTCGQLGHRAFECKQGTQVPRGRAALLQQQVYRPMEQGYPSPAYPYQQRYPMPLSHQQQQASWQQQQVVRDDRLQFDNLTPETQTPETASTNLCSMGLNRNSWDASSVDSAGTRAGARSMSTTSIPYVVFLVLCSMATALATVVRALTRFSWCMCYRTFSKQAWAGLTKAAKQWTTPVAKGVYELVLDGGATHHVVSIPPENFTQFTTTVDDPSVALLLKGYAKDGPSLTAIGRGTLFGIENVYCVPGLQSNLISEMILLRLVQRGYGHSLDINTLTKTFKFPNGKILLQVSPKDNLFKGCGVVEKASIHLVGGRHNNPALEAHARLGHPAWPIVRMCNKMGMFKPKLSAEALNKAEREPCDACHLSKATRARKPVRNEDKRQNAEPLGQFSMDIAVLTNLGIGGKKYALIFWDKRTGAIHTEALSRRTGADVAASLKRYMLQVVLPNTNTKRFQAQILRSDGAQEFLSPEVTEVCHAHGIHREITCAFSSYQNGGAERAIRTVMSRARTMLVAARLPTSFWPYAIEYASYLHNRMPCPSRDGQSPFQIVNAGILPNLDNCKVFGSRCWVKKLPNEIAQGDAMSARAYNAVYLGPGRTQKGDKVFIIERQKVLVRESVKFDTSPAWNSHGLQPKEGEKKFIRECASQQRPTVAPLRDHRSRPTRTRKPPSQIIPGYTFHMSSAYGSCYANSTRGDQYWSIQDSHFPNHNTNSKSNPRPSGYSGDPAQKPGSMRKALRGQNATFWNEARLSELASLDRYDAVEMADIPPHTKLLHMIWILALKQDEHGNTVRYKARTCVNGSQQVEGIHYTDTTAPVPAAATIRTVLSIAAAKSMKIRQWDFETAFLNSPLEEEIYVHPPFGTTLPKGKCWRLKKCIYGLKQASRNWFGCLKAALEKAGLKQTEADPCLFIGKDEHRRDYYFLFHVDDVLLAVHDVRTENKLLKTLSAMFKIKAMGNINWFLGMKVTCLKEGGYKIDQEQYVTKILQKFQAYNYTPTDTPGTDKHKLAQAATTPSTKEDLRHQTPAKIKLYKEIVGSLLFAAMMTRPDIACVVGLLSRAMDKPKLVHWLAVKHIFRYLRGTLSLGLVYAGKVRLIGYSDANWGGDVDKTSTSGYIFKLNGGAIAWASKRQRAVAISSCESEYYAASLAISEVIWLRLLCSELGMKLDTATTIIWEDNQGTIALSKGPSKRNVSKHIDIRHHFMRQHVKDKKVALKYIKTNDNVADALTKPLPRPAFLQHRYTMMGELPKPYKYTNNADLHKI